MSKFALRALADAITPELSLNSVTVTLISPGFVASDIRRVDNQGTLQAGAPDPIPQWLVVPTEKAARQILRAVAQEKARGDHYRARQGSRGHRTLHAVAVTRDQATNRGQGRLSVGGGSQ